MDKLVDSFGRGENPSPAEPQPRAPTAEEITAEANRIAANARDEEEANMLARQLANAQAEADAKRAQEIATVARLKAFQYTEAAIFNTQPPGGQDQQVTARAVGDDASPSPLLAHLTESGGNRTKWDPDSRPLGGPAEEPARGQGQG